MPTIYDNLETKLAEGLRNAMTDATSLDACVGYFNLRGWNQVAESVEELKSDDACRLLVGMSVSPNDELRHYFPAAFDGQPGNGRVDASGPSGHGRALPGAGPLASVHRAPHGL